MEKKNPLLGWIICAISAITMSGVIASAVYLLFK